jgi:hypothetical protein
VYTQHYNRRHARVGHLFQGRYKAIIVEKDSYLLELCRYIALNPVRAGVRKTAGQWKWSSYRATAGIAEVPIFLKVDWMLSQFGRDKRAARERYRKFVAEGVKRGSPWENLKGQIFLGTEEFVSRLRVLLEKKVKVKVKEAPRAQRYATRPPLEKLLPQNALMAGPTRDEIVWQAHCDYGYRLREIADHLGAHYSTVSRAVKKVEQQRILQRKT